MATTTYPVTTLKLPRSPAMAAEIVQLFERHGCTLTPAVTHITLSVPSGTFRTEILPRLQLPRFWLHFPDSWKLHETLDWNEESLLAIPVSGRAGE